MIKICAREQQLSGKEIPNFAGSRGQGMNILMAVCSIRNWDSKR